MPDCVRLEVLDGVEPSPKPPVRIYLGTQAAQWRAERVFVWSIMRVRDPSRVYEIYLMRELLDFDRARWTTGFTNYRFAIPELAGSKGRAIYNDTDQIYLADPAEFFDLEMGDHGYLAIAPEDKVDTAVMLLDCERMAEVWTLEDARREHKKKLIAAARKVEGLRGELPGEWHARDDGYTPEDRYVEGKSKCLHYTTLHMQPWRPQPERFVYQENPVGQLWYELEAQADHAGFQQLRRARPSARYLAIAQARATQGGAPPHEVVEESPELAAALEDLEEATGASGVAIDVIGEPDWSRVGDGGVLLGAELAALPEDDVPWVLDEVFAHAGRFVVAEVVCRQAPASPPATATTLETAADRWPAYFAAASRRQPDVSWHLIVCVSGEITHHRGGRHIGADEPRVWIFGDDANGRVTPSLRGIVEELGWSYSLRTPIRRDLAPPWPDLVLASGRESAEAARWVREQSHARTRVLLIGEGAGADTSGVDLVVTSIAQGFYPDPKRLAVNAPLPRWDASELDTVTDSWRKLFEGVPGPHIALMVEGAGGVRRFDAARARQLGAAALRRATREGGSLFALLDARLPTVAREALTHTLVSGGAHVQQAEIQGDEPSVLAHLALADVFIVPDDQEALIGDVCGTRKPVWLYPTPLPPPTPNELLRNWIGSIARLERQNDRGTIRPQQGLELFCSQLIARGWVAPPRDLPGMHEALFASKQAAALEVGALSAVLPEADERVRVAAAIRELLGLAKGGANLAPPESEAIRRH